MNYQNIPESLKTARGWILWKKVKKDDKIIKLPIKLDGSSDMWNTTNYSFDEVKDFELIGLQPKGKLICIDLDKCFDDEGRPNKAALDALSLNSYAEYSPSGKGLHVWVNTTIEYNSMARKGIELFANSKYCTITGNVYKNNEVKTCDISWLINKYFNSTSRHTADPLLKKGPIGSFCRAISINEALEMTGMYTHIDGDRWHYNPSESAPGVLTYEGKWAISNHATDPLCDGHEHNAFDVVRIHKGFDVNDMIKWGSGLDKVKEQIKIDEADIDANYYSKRGALVPSLLVKVLIEENDIMYMNGYFYIYGGGVYTKYDKAQMSKFISRYLKPSKTARQVNEVMEQLSWDTRIDADTINMSRHIINFKNCVIDADTWDVKSHSPDYKTTIQYPINYKPEATCAVWQKFLDEVLTKDQQKLLQEVMGYMLTLDNRAKKFFLLHGAADSGKSVILKTLIRILGERNTSALELKKITDKDSRFYASRLFQKVANVCGDITGDIEDTGALKLLTGDDRITGEEKGKDVFEFYNFARLIFSCNQLPNSYSDKTKAFYNRLLLIDFPISIPKDQQDSNLINKFNLEGVLNWMLEGTKRLFKNNLCFTLSQVNKDKLEAYELANNSTLGFIKEMCSNEGSISAPELYSHYSMYCQTAGLKAKGRNKFIDEVKTLGYQYSTNITINGKKCRGFSGLKI